MHGPLGLTASCSVFLCVITSSTAAASPLVFFFPRPVCCNYCLSVWPCAASPRGWVSGGRFCLFGLCCVGFADGLESLFSSATSSGSPLTVPRQSASSFVVDSRARRCAASPWLDSPAADTVHARPPENTGCSICGTNPSVLPPTFCYVYSCSAVSPPPWCHTTLRSAVSSLFSVRVSVPSLRPPWHLVSLRASVA